MRAHAHYRALYRQGTTKIILKSYGKFARANMMSAMVSALPLLRFAEKQGWLGHRVSGGSGVHVGLSVILVEARF